MGENNSFKQKSIFTTSESQSKDEISDTTFEKENNQYETVYDEMTMLIEEDKDEIENLTGSGDSENAPLSALANEDIDISETTIPSPLNVNCNNQGQNTSVIEYSAPLQNRNLIFNDFYFKAFQNPLLSINTSNNLNWKSNIKENIVPFKSEIKKPMTRNFSFESEVIDSFNNNVVTLSDVIRQPVDKSVTNTEKVSNYEEGTPSKIKDVNAFQRCSDDCMAGNKIGEQITLVSPNERIQPDTYHAIEGDDYSTPKEMNSISNHRTKYQNLGTNRSPKNFINGSCDERTKNLSVECMVVEPVANICGHTEADKFLPVRKLPKKSPINKSKRHFKKPNTVLSVLKFKKQSKDTFFALFIAELLRSTHPNLRLNVSICQKIELFLRDMIYRIGDEAENLMALSERKFFTPRVLKFAIKFCLEHIKNEADAVTGRKTLWMV